MNNLIKIAQIIKIVIPTLTILIFGGFFLYRFLIKKGIIKIKPKDESVTDFTGAEERPIEDFNLVEDFRENFVISGGGKSFTCGMKCSGVALDKMTDVEQYLVAENHIGFYTMLTWNMQMYIQSRQMNVQSNIDFIEEALKAVQRELSLKEEKRKKIQNIIDEAPSRREDFNQEIIELDKAIASYKKQVKWKTEELQYAKKVASPQSPPQYDVFVLFTYKHDDSAFTTPLSDDEIFTKAKVFMDSKLSSSITALKRCETEATILDPKQIAEVIYRAYNLSDADVVPFEDIFRSAAFDLVPSTDYFIRKVPSKDLEHKGEEIAC